MTYGRPCEQAAEIPTVLRHSGWCLSFSSSSECWTFQYRDRYAQCQTVQGTVKTSQVQFLCEVGRARRCATTGAGDGPDSTKNRDGAAVAVCRRGRRHLVVA